MDKTFIEQHIDYVLKETNFPKLGEKKVGKVRDVYIQKDKLILVATDRYSAFDRNLALIPFKGQVLTQISDWWFEKTKDIIQNHVIDTPDPNVVVAKKCELIPIEMVVRGYITGVTRTSLWTFYQSGQRDFGDFALPDGMKKNQKLEQPVLTPTTKGEKEDKSLTTADVLQEKMVPEELWKKLRDVALKLFARGQELAAARELILVDTKYEFGLTENGDLMLIDEIHTPDSSRYWQLASYEERFAKGEEPEYFDKEFLRLWFKERSDPYKDAVMPKAPQELIAELSSRYIKIYEQITGCCSFEPQFELPVEKRIAKNLAAYFTKCNPSHVFASGAKQSQTNKGIASQPRSRSARRAPHGSE